MSASEDPKTDLSTESKINKATETATAPVDAPETSKANTEQSTYSGLASAATSSATNAAVGVKDSVFSMFGGGAKKDKREDDETQDRSGSSKAQKEAEGEDEEVELAYLFGPSTLAYACNLGSTARVGRCAFRTCCPFDREGGYQDQRGTGRANLQDACKAF